VAILVRVCKLCSCKFDLDYRFGRPREYGWSASRLEGCEGASSVADEAAAVAASVPEVEGRLGISWF
jgi:hypothetical protein